MKISEAVAITKELTPNVASDQTYMRWLSDLDGKIFRELMVGLEGCPDEAPGVYSDMDTVLLVAAPDEELYVRYLSAKIHQQNGDYDRYNNEIVAYNNEYSAYAAAYARTHRTTDTASMPWNDDDDLTADL